MKKIFFLMLTLLIWGTASMNAQVLIGGDGNDNPDPSAVLELKSSNLGFLLPRVALQSTTDKTTITGPVVGLAVYNIATVGTGATAVAPGIYVFTGTAWALQAPPVIITQPKSFSWSRVYEEVGDPNGPASATIEDLTVEASGTGLTYQWYKKAVNKNAADTLLTSETNSTYAPTVTAWGMNSYYCVVSNAYGSVTSNVANVTIGCGAKTADGGWLKFMCHNLGASPVDADISLDEITFASDGTGYGGPDTISTDAKGWLFQWGRIADGHQWRGTTNVTVAGPYESETNIEVPSSHPMYGQFITNNSMLVTAYDWRSPQCESAWRNWNEMHWSCPAGWKVPSSSDWSTLYSSGLSHGTPGEATSNTWFPENEGCGIRPDGITTTLFLPAAGFRRGHSGEIRNVGEYGVYWATSLESRMSGILQFSPTIVSPKMNLWRGFGASIRCIAE
jgi:uncharacterized protein (TIGR02145 family)